MSRDDPSDEAEGPVVVGYGKPPVEHRFKPGASGNPGGRPKKKAKSNIPHALSDSLAVDHVLLGEAYRHVTLREGDQPVTLSTVSAVYRALAVSGLKGNRLAAKTFVEQVEKAEGRRRAQAIEIIDIAAKYKNDWSQEIEWAKRNGVAPPVVYPHPDDLLIGADGIPYVVGPNTAAEQAEWDRLQSRARDADEAIRRELANWKSKAPRNANYKSCYFDEMVHEHRMRVNIRFAVPDEVTRRAHRYRRPTGDNIREFQIATRAKYPLHKDLPAEQVRTFIFEVEFYERKIAMFATTSR